MRECHRSQRRIAEGRGVEREQAVLSEFEIVERGNLHEKIVRMLGVGYRRSKRGLALLEKQWILAAGNCGGLKTQHHAGSKCSRPRVMLRHAHKPVGRK